MDKENIKSTNKKFPKFKRAVGEKPGLRLQPRDIQIIRLVYDHRLLNSDQIKAISDGSDQVISRRLQKLFHHGYLDRPRQQFSSALESKAMIYALSNKGADILATEYGIDRGKINWRTKNYEVKIGYLNHTMMIANFRVCLTLALKDLPGTEILFWQQHEVAELRDWVFIKDDKGGKTRIPVNPDVFFGIQDTTGKSYFFLEADQSTMTNPRFFRKTKGYWHYWKQNTHTKKYNIKNFRVLTLTISSQRADNLRQVTKLADDRQKGSLMFWFTSEKSYGLEDPRSILKPIWHTPVDESWHYILE